MMKIAYEGTAQTRFFDGVQGDKDRQGCVDLSLFIEVRRFDTGLVGNYLVSSEHWDL